MKVLVSYVIGLVFGTGISVSGMINPAKVLNFFDVAGTWDPSLALVLAAAVIVASIGYKFTLSMSAPILGETFHVPQNQKIDLQLIVGAAVFGIGWGMVGFCPGAGLPALGTGQIEVIQFVAALVAGIFATKMLMKLTSKP